MRIICSAPKVDAFNMKSEQEEGRFDDAGNFGKYCEIKSLFSRSHISMENGTVTNSKF